MHLGVQVKHFVLQSVLRDVRVAAAESGGRMSQGRLLGVIQSLASAWRAHTVLCVIQESALRSEDSPIPAAPVIPPAENTPHETNITHAFQCLRHLSACLGTQVDKPQQYLRCWMQLTDLWLDLGMAVQLLAGEDDAGGQSARSSWATSPSPHATRKDSSGAGAKYSMPVGGLGPETAAMLRESMVWPPPAQPGCTVPLLLQSRDDHKVPASWTDHCDAYSDAAL